MGKTQMMISIPLDLRNRVNRVKEFGYKDFASRICTAALYDHVVTIENDLIKQGKIREIEETPTKKDEILKDLGIKNIETETKVVDELIEENPLTEEKKVLSSDNMNNAILERIKKLRG